MSDGTYTATRGAPRRRYWTDRAAALVCALVLAACEPVGRGPDACGAGDYAGLVGASIVEVTQPVDRDIRVVGPDDAVTFDHRPERLNIETDAAGIIRNLRCG